MVGDGKRGDDIVQRADVGIRGSRWKDYENEGYMVSMKMEGGKRI